MRKTDYLSLCALILAGAAASSALVTGCGGDDNGGTGTEDSGAGDTGTTPPGQDGSLTPDTSTTSPEASDDGGQPGKDDAGEKPDTSTGTDGGKGDAAIDSAVPDTGTDSAIPDTGTDSSIPDTGTDSTVPDAGTDSAVPDAGTDSATTPDAADDGATGTDSATTDASGDANTSDASDAALPIGFANPVQVDVSSILNANTVVTTAAGGVLLTAMDGPTAASGADNDFPTQSEALKLDSSGKGLPDNAFFPSDGTNYPNIQLAWTNTANVKNSIVVQGSAGTTSSFAVPQAQYSQVQIYATGGNGGAILNITLTYTSGAAVSSTMPLPDWCSSGLLSGGEFRLPGVDRVQAGTLFNGSPLCSIYAINLNPDPARTLKQVSIQDNGTSNDYMVFYGATAW